MPRTWFLGVERYVIWMVIGGNVYPLNSPSKMVSPSLPWPREALEATWKKTNLSPYSAASDAIEIIFGR